VRSRPFEFGHLLRSVHGYPFLKSKNDAVDALLDGGLEAKGAAQTVKGKAQQAAGKARSGAKKATR
jgi:hypothetical protein